MCKAKYIGGYTWLSEESQCFTRLEKLSCSTIGVSRGFWLGNSRYSCLLQCEPGAVYLRPMGVTWGDDPCVRFLWRTQSDSNLRSPVPTAVTSVWRPCPRTPANSSTNAMAATGFSNPSPATAASSAPTVRWSVRQYNLAGVVRVGLPETQNGGD